MDDLIRRQDAIDAIRASALKYTGFMEMEMYTDNDAIEAIEDLTSAQQWIPCSKGLPEENEFYLATIYSREMQKSFCDKLFYGIPQLYENKKIGWYFVRYDGDVEQVFNVKAWMPLPEPYKAESEK